MKNKLSLKTETIRTLSSAELDAVGGGFGPLSSVLAPQHQTVSSAYKPVHQTVSSVHKPPAHPPLSSVKPGPVAHPTSTAIFTLAK
jgi:hypothetical protein